MSSVFARFEPRLQQAIVSRLGWSSLRPVQEQAGAALLDGCNAVVLAPTAGGKTEASMFPVLSGLIHDPPEGLAALYIAPIKALLNNQAERLGTYTEMVGFRRMVWHGDVGAHARKSFLKEPAELLMTTPESLEVMLVSERVDAAALFRDLRVVVIDEVHALAGSDRGAHLMSVIERLAQLSTHDVQRVGLSATVGNPDQILTWLQGTSAREGRVVDPPKVPGPRQLLVVHREDLERLAHDAAKLARGKKSLFFCQSRSTTEAVAEHMRRHGTTVFVHHSAVSKEERERAEERFHHGSDACIVATSTLELGIDVGDLDLVLQAEAPDTVGSFLQRMGRTGRRAGQAANTTFFCTSPDAVLQAMALIQLARQGWVESVEVNDRCWPVLVHQLLAMALASNGVTLHDAWAHLSSVPDFKGIHRGEFDRLIAWMLRDRSMLDLSGRLVLGPRAERRFGRRNFMELFAVFSSPQSYAVLTATSAPLGTLNQGFVDRLVEGVSCFLLGGRGWVVQRIDHNERTIQVQPAPRGRQPSWGGYLPQFLGFDICQAALAILTDSSEPSYLHPTALDVLHQVRDAFAGILEPRIGGIEVDEGEIRWWTFAGGKVNGTLRYALESIGGDWKVIPDNFLIKIRGEDLDLRTFERAVDELRDPEFWENAQLWDEVAEMLPTYRLSKFQPLMPPWVQREMVATYLLDVQGAWRWLAQASHGSLDRVPSALREQRPDEEHAAPAPVPFDPTPPEVVGKLPIRWIDTEADLARACQEIAQHDRIGLDVETTLRTRSLCLVQIATPEAVYLIDALRLADLDRLGPILMDEGIVKIIHNASFERSVLGAQGLEIHNVFDTLAASRARAPKAEGGHSLAVVCERELGITLDKRQQTSDWSRRPLSARQTAYAALDAEVLLGLGEG
ncbi:MAG: DEAD/DEAH box helicase, partial [Deltaproteobacteria bacterium]